MGNDGLSQDFDTMTNALKLADAFVTAIVASVTRWSSRALQDKADDLASAIENISILMCVGNYVLLTRSREGITSDVLVEQRQEDDIAKEASERDFDQEARATSTLEDGASCEREGGRTRSEAHDQELVQRRPIPAIQVRHVKELWAKASKFGLALKDSIKGLRMVHETLLKRLGSEFCEGLADDSTPAYTAKLVDKNYKVLEDLHTYLLRWLFLSQSDSILTCEEVAAADIKGKYMWNLAEYCKLHLALQAPQHFELELGNILDASAAAEDFCEVLRYLLEFRRQNYLRRACHICDQIVDCRGLEAQG